MAKWKKLLIGLLVIPVLLFAWYWIWGYYRIWPMGYGAPPGIRYGDLYLSPQSGKVLLEESELEELGVVQSVVGNRDPLEEHLQTNDETLEGATVYQDENGAIYIKVQYEGRLLGVLAYDEDGEPVSLPEGKTRP